MGKSIQTANYYLTALKGFTRWLWKDRRSAADPLAGMSKLANAAADVRHARRDFAPRGTGPAAGRRPDKRPDGPESRRHPLRR